MSSEFQLDVSLAALSGVGSGRCKPRRKEILQEVGTATQATGDGGLDKCCHLWERRRVIDLGAILDLHIVAILELTEVTHDWPGCGEREA